MGEYIGKNGHKNIGLITVDQQDKAVGVFRTQGILDGLKEHSVNEVYMEYCDFSFLDAQNATWELFSKHTDIDAIVCATDRIAFGAYRVLKKKANYIKVNRN